MKKLITFGSVGTFHEEAALSIVENSTAIEFCKTFEELATQIAKRQACTGLMAISNDHVGPIMSNYHQLLKNECVDILQVDICSAGGLTEAKRIATLASTYGIEIVPHTWGTGIAFHTALHFIANLEPIPGRLFPPDCFIEYDRTENGIREQLTCPSIELKDGYIDVPQRPGLGIEVNEEALLYYTQKNKNGIKIS